MSGEAQSPPDYRFMIRAFADVSDPGNPNDLQNINTAPLPNGAMCYVIGNRAAYVLDKFSDASADGSSIFAPIAGGGRWVLFGAGAGGAPGVMAFSSEGATNTFVTDGTWVQSNSASFSATELNELARWSFTASGCILTWNGGTLPMLATLTMSLSIGDATPARDIFAFISHNNDAPAITTGGAEGRTLAVQTVDGATRLIMATQRLLPSVTNGATFRPKFSAAAGAVSGEIAALQLVVRPL